MENIIKNTNNLLELVAHIDELERAVNMTNHIMVGGIDILRHAGEDTNAEIQRFIKAAMLDVIGELKGKATDMLEDISDELKED